MSARQQTCRLFRSEEDQEVAGLAPALALCLACPHAAGRHPFAWPSASPGSPTAATSPGADLRRKATRSKAMAITPGASLFIGLDQPMSETCAGGTAGQGNRGIHG